MTTDVVDSVEAAGVAPAADAGFLQRYGTIIEYILIPGAALVGALAVFGLFVAVLVGVELLKILRHLLAAHEVSTSLVAQTALIALCNKVITVNLSEASWTTLVAVAALILSLTAAIYALRQAHL